MSSSIGKNYLWNVSYQLLLIVVPLVTTPYLSRVLGAEQVGVYSYTYSIANYFVLFATLGMSQHGVRVVAQVGDDRAKRSRAFWSAWLSQLCIAVPVALIYFCYSLISPAGGTVVALIWGLWVLGAVFDVSWLFFGVEEFKLPTIRSFVTKLAGMAIIFIFCHGPDDLWAYCLSFAGAVFANSVLLWPFVKKYVDIVKPTWPEVRENFIPNLRLFAPVVAISLYTSLNKIWLGSVSGMEEAGYFEYSDKIVRMPLAIVTSLGTVMLPHMSSMLAKRMKSEAVALLGKSIWAMEMVAFGMAFGIAAIAPEIANVFLGKGFEACAYVLPVEAAMIPLIAASNAIGVQYLLPAHSDRAYTLSVFFGAIVNIVACLLLLKPFGAVGAGLATVAAEAAVLLFQCLVVRKDLPLWSYLRESIPYLICGALMCAAVRLASNLLVGPLGESWALLIVEILIGIVVYAALALACCAISGRASDLKALLRRR
jgi:O-antigen/teichoic acid export membrane protein